MSFTKQKTQRNPILFQLFCEFNGPGVQDLVWLKIVSFDRELPLRALKVFRHSKNKQMEVLPTTLFIQYSWAPQYIFI